MTNAELAKYVGKEGHIQVGTKALSILVRSLDAREVFGRLDVLVEPVSGYGKDWVAESGIEWSK